MNINVYGTFKIVCISGGVLRTVTLQSFWNNVIDDLKNNLNEFNDLTIISIIAVGDAL